MHPINKKASLVADYNTGNYSFSQLTDKYDISISTVSLWLKDAGVIVRKQGRQRKATQPTTFDVSKLKPFFLRQRNDCTQVTIRCKESKEHPTVFITSLAYFNMSIAEQYAYRENALQFFRKTGYPYASYDDETAIKDFEKLKNDDSQVAQHWTSHCWHFNKHYLNAKAKNRASTSEAFDNDDTVRHVLHSRMLYCENMSYANFRRGFRLLGTIKTVGNFRPAMAKHIYNTYCPTGGVVYDMSSGFGGRLVGACASHTVSKYIATDPSLESYIGVKAIYEVLKNNTAVTTELHNLGSEVLFLPDASVDLCFTSPPYFDCEVYSDDLAQCYNKFPEKQAWINGYLLPTFLNCFNCLKYGGRMLINVDDVREMPDLCDIVKNTARIAGFTYDAVLDYKLTSSPLTGKSENAEPIFIFTKQPS